MIHNDRIWSIVQLIPVLFLIWHAILAFLGTPFLWIVEIPWLLVYGIALIILFNPGPAGYLYVTLLILLNLGWELWISYLSLDEFRSIAYCLPGLMLIYLYKNHGRFRVQNNFIRIPLLALALLILETTWFGVQIEYYKLTTEWHQWNTTHTGYSSGMVKWYSQDKLVAKFLYPNNVQGNVRYLGTLDLSTQEVTLIDEQGELPRIFKNDQLIGYYKNAGWIMEGKIRHSIDEFIWYNVATGQKETAFKTISYGNRFEFIYPKEGLGTVTRFAILDPNTLLVSRKAEPYLYICKLDGQILRKIYFPNADMVHFTVSLNGQRLYVIQPAGISYYDLNNPEKGWVEIGKAPNVREGPDGKYIYSFENSELSYCDLAAPQQGWHVIGKWIKGYSLGPDGMVIFNKRPSDTGPYQYLSAKDIIQQGLWLFKPGMEAPIRITSDRDQAPSISPDGKTVSFSRDYDKFPYLLGISRSELMLLTR